MNEGASSDWFTTPDGESFRLSAIMRVGSVSRDTNGAFYFTILAALQTTVVCFYDTQAAAETTRRSVVGWPE